MEGSNLKNKPSRPVNKSDVEVCFFIIYIEQKLREFPLVSENNRIIYCDFFYLIL